MKKINIFMGILSLTFIFPPAVSAVESSKSVLSESKILFKKADKLQGAWVTTWKLIKKAEAAIKKGNQKEGLKLAKKARSEARMSIEQAEEQLKNWVEPPYIER